MKISNVLQPLVLSAVLLVCGDVAIAGEPEDVKTAKWIGAEQGKMTCSAMKRTKRYDSASIESDLNLYGGATYKYTEETLFRWYKEGKDSLAGLAIKAMHDYMRANCLKEFDKYTEALPGYLPMRLPPLPPPLRTIPKR